jgi:GT2 family glycosyltransferase
VSRTAVTVVMPFAGDRESARRAVASLTELGTAEHDELIVADNSGTVDGETAGVTVVRAAGEASPAHARNAGAAAASRDWILFLDADCIPSPDLIDSYFADPIAGDVGALAGEIVPAPGATTVAERYAAARNFLGQQAHLAHPYRPRAAAANLLVRRSAFEQIGGFVEGVRTAEDTDFCWRLEDAGWRLEARPAAVEHQYRATVRGLRRQWREYAAGRAWLATRYPGFKPEPALARVVRGRGRRGTAPPATVVSAGRPAPPLSSRDRLLFLALDGVLAVDELVGLRKSNRPEPR